ncbi:MAG: hypothetical protein ACAI38_16510 [Myxococcota bacterium]|nr:hypothetical protein [Myxococcota bacterium]
MVRAELCQYGGDANNRSFNHAMTRAAQGFNVDAGRANQILAEEHAQHRTGADAYCSSGPARGSGGRGPNQWRPVPPTPQSGG